jgi:hypothetical protein
MSKIDTGRSAASTTLASVAGCLGGLWFYGIFGALSIVDFGSDRILVFSKYTRQFLKILVIFGTVAAG